MKKLLLLIVGVLMVFPTLAQTFEYEYDGQTLRYQTLWSSDSPAVEVSAVDNTLSGEVTIPSTVNYEGVEYSVTSIGNYAFNCCGGMTSVTIPNSVTSIGEGAFMVCENLTSVTIPDSVSSIGNYAFNECRGLTSVTIPNSVTSIGEGAFMVCENLTSVTIPNSVTSIGDYAFSCCWGLTSVTIPNSVTSIGNQAFSECSKLATVVLLNPDAQIGLNVFDGYDDSRKLTLYTPKSLGVCYPGITKYVVFDPETTEVLQDGTMLTDNGKSLMLAKVENGGSYTIPDGVELIMSGAFPTTYYDEYLNIHPFLLESLTIPASVEVVEADAFAEVTINRVNFEDWARWCENVTLGNLNSVPYRNGSVYAGGVKINSMELKEGMTEIRDYVNYGLDGFKDEVELPTTLKRVGAYAFFNNKELYHVFLNDGLEEIGEHAFDGCELLENQVFPASLRKIETEAYKNCTSLTEVELPEGLSEFGNGVFVGCSSLEKAVLVADIDEIPNYTFVDCTALSKIYFPLQLKKIGDYAFQDCYALDEVKFPSTLETIGDCAFATSFGGSLTKLVLPNSVTAIGTRAFSHQRLKSLTLGSGLEVIPYGAFEYNFLMEIDFSEGLKKIGEHAFGYNSYNLGSVVLPSTVTEIERDAFRDCYIRELVIPDGVMALPAGSCGNPSMLTIGSGIKEIDAAAFGFNNLITFRLMATMPPTLNEAFPLTNDQNDQLTLVVNAERAKYYQTNARWKQIDNILEESATDVIVYLDGSSSLAMQIRLQSGLMPSRVSKLKVVGPLSESDLATIRANMISLRSLDLSEVTNVTELPAEQFTGSLLSEIVLPPNIEKIGDNAFQYCFLLQLSELPETIKEIGYGAFANCPGVKIKRLPAALESLGDNAFENCIGIREITAGSNLSFFGMNGYIFAGCSLLEKVDLSESAIPAISPYAFSGCTELDDIRLPETATSIGYGAFTRTAIRDLSFIPQSVESIDGRAFADCRRLVAATLPEKVTSVDGELFADCPRLLAVSMPKVVGYVAENIVDNDKKLANISCAAVEAPTAEIGAFNNIRLRYVSLTIPTLSFLSYLEAIEWGKFETILNRIPVTIDKGVEVTNVGEDEYQDMLKEDILEEAQELATAEQEQGEEPAQIARRRVARRAAARATTNRSFASLFDGAQISTGNDGSGTRIFINPEEGVTLTSVKFNGEEMISRMEGNSLLLPAGSNGDLEIRTSAGSDNSGDNVGIVEIDYDEPYKVYDLNGLKVADNCDSLLPGIYVLRQGNAVKKVVIK